MNEYMGGWMDGWMDPTQITINCYQPPRQERDKCKMRGFRSKCSKETAKG